MNHKPLDVSFLANVDGKAAGKLAFNIIDTISKHNNINEQALAPALVFLALCRCSGQHPSVFLDYAERIITRSDSHHLKAIVPYLDEQVFKKHG